MKVKDLIELISLFCRVIKRAWKVFRRPSERHVVPIFHVNSVAGGVASRIWYYSQARIIDSEFCPEKLEYRFFIERGKTKTSRKQFDITIWNDPDTNDVKNGNIDLIASRVNKLINM